MSNDGAAATLNARQQQLLERVQADGEVKIAEAKELYQVTEMTIRRDLERLEAAGYVKRTFGGAIFIGRDVSIQDRTGFMAEEKSRIGRIAASLIAPGDSVFIDGGTTTQQIVRHLPSGMEITVVTNALNVAAELSTKRISVVVTGGTLREATSSLVGPLAAQALTGMAFDRVFLGATGVNAEHGFSNSNLYEAEIKRLAVKQAAETIVVMDHTKFGSRALASFASLASVRRVVTDVPPQDGLAAAFEDAGIEVLTGADR